MPSFDIVSEVDLQEVKNAVDNANRELTTRFDFRGVDAQFDSKDTVVSMHAEAEFQLQQMLDILAGKMVKRGLDIQSLEHGDVEHSGKIYKQQLTVKQGIDQAMSKKLVKLIKESKIKVQASIQGDQVRVNGKKRDDLQQVMALIREGKLDQPFQFNNFRD